MRWSEWIALVYFAGLGLVSWVRPLPLSRRVRITIVAVAAMAAIPGVAFRAPLLVRNWLPPLLILAGYYLSGQFYTAPSERFERWLVASDVKLLGDPSTRFAAWPRVAIAYLELIYMGCFLLVPGGFALLAAAGHAEIADRYWTLVVAGEFGAFAPLAFVAARPPWAIERPPQLADQSAHTLGSYFVQQFTIRVNTFPSGHAAGSLVVAFAVFSVMPAAGAVLLALAVSIGVACFVCRYHYVADVAAGALLAIVIWGAVAAAGV